MAAAISWSLRNSRAWFRSSAVGCCERGDAEVLARSGRQCGRGEGVLDDFGVRSSAELGQRKGAEAAPGPVGVGCLFDPGAGQSARLVRSRRGGRRCSRRSPARRPRGGGRANAGSEASSSAQSSGSVRSRHEQASDGRAPWRAASSRSRFAASQAPRGPQIGQLPAQERRPPPVRARSSAVSSIQAVSSTAQRTRYSCRRVVFTRRGQPVEAEAAEGLEHAVSGPALEGCVDHGGVDEVGQSASRVAGEAKIGGDSLGGVQVDSID